jgi:predicted Zn-dependent protease
MTNRVLGRSWNPLLGLALLGVTLWSCSTVPLSGRSQLNLVPESEMQSMSYTQYGQFLKDNPLSTDATNTALVKRVGARIQGAVEANMARSNLSDQLAGYKWEFNLVESKDQNAWCMPGGKVVVYSGILPITKDETGLAVVLGHEIAHAIAEHGGERMSQGLLAQMGGLALSEALREKPEQTRSLWMSAFGGGAEVGVLLPFSRLQESEADHLGLIFMAMAGYDPRAALDFWKRMASEKHGGAPPQFLSTHPSDEARIRKIGEELPDAMRYYQKAVRTSTAK